MNLLKTLLLGSVVLAGGAYGAAYDTVKAAPANINCTSDASCALLGTVQVAGVTLGGVTGTGFYSWNASSGCTPDTSTCLRPTGATKAFELQGFTAAGAPVISGSALGAPASGTHTNATGLPLTNGATGGLPPVNGGTTSFTIETTNGASGQTLFNHSWTAVHAAGWVMVTNGATVAGDGGGAVWYPVGSCTPNVTCVRDTNGTGQFWKSLPTATMPIARYSIVPSMAGGYLTTVTAAINQAFADGCAGVFDVPIDFGSTGWYVNATITNPCAYHTVGTPNIIGANGSFSPVVLIGSSGALKICSKGEVSSYSVSSSTQVMRDGQVGLEDRNLMSCNLAYTTTGFFVGHKSSGVGGFGNYSNTYYPGRMLGNEWGEEIYVDSAPASFNNVNHYVGGEYASGGARGSNNGGCIWINIQNSKDMDGHTFDHPSCEMYPGASTGKTHGVFITNPNGGTITNIFYNAARLEGPDYLLGGAALAANGWPGVYSNHFSVGAYTSTSTAYRPYLLFNGNTAADTTAFALNDISIGANAKLVAGTEYSAASGDNLLNAPIVRIDRSQFVVSGGKVQAPGPALWSKYGATDWSAQEDSATWTLKTGEVVMPSSSARNGILAFIDFTNEPSDYKRRFRFVFKPGATYAQSALKIKIWNIDGTTQYTTAADLGCVARSVASVSYTAAAWFGTSLLSSTNPYMDCAVSRNVAYAAAGTAAGNANGSFQNFSIIVPGNSNIVPLYNASAIAEIASLGLFRTTSPMTLAAPDVPATGDSEPTGICATNRAPKELGSTPKYFIAQWCWPGATAWLPGRQNTGN